MGEWIDLLDPSPEELERHLPEAIHESDLAQLHALGAAGRPNLAAQGDHVFGVLLIAVADPSKDDVYYQEVDVVLTRDSLLTVRKTTPGRPAYDSAQVRAARQQDDSAATCLYRVAADIADKYLDLVDDLEEEIGDLEDHIEDWPGDTVTLRIRRLRHQILHVRRTLAPLRDAIRAVVDGRIDLADGTLFPRSLEHEFGSVYDRLLRAADGLEMAHDLLSGARDYYQAKVAQDQNEIVKRLTAIASILLVPTFIVGLYGQNFLKMPEYHWGIWGYVWSWSWIIATTVIQVWYFRKKRWL
jgi:magnesium transporter